MRSRLYIGLNALLTLALVAASVVLVTPPATAVGVASTFSTPGTQTYTVPAGVTQIRVEAWGAAGADSNGTGPYVGQPGGAGGGALAILTVTPGQQIQVNVGAKAGGGAGGTGGNATNNRGGAASDIRVGACAAGATCALTDRVVVAGGGGGPGAYAPGSGMIVACGGAGGSTGNGSGAAGCDERVQYPHVHGGGAGATSSAAGGGGYGATGGASYGAAGTLGFGGTGGGGGTGSSSPGGGGGDGYYGGGGGGGGNIYGGAGGGGGSSYVTPSATFTAFLGAAPTRGNGSITITALTGVTATSTVVTSSVTNASTSQQLVYTATISPAPTAGVVSFTADGEAIAGCSNRPISGGTATCTTAFTTIGTHAVTGAYLGSDDHLPSRGGYSQATSAATTTMTLTTPVSTVEADAVVAYTATVSPKPTAGTVTFSLNGTALTACTNVAVNTGNGIATCGYSHPSYGTGAMTATFNGTTHYLTSTSSALNMTFTNNITATTVTANNSPTGIGQSPIFTATVSPAPSSGTVGFTDNGSAISGCTAVAVSSTTGVARCSVTYLAAGAHSIVATYGGALEYSASTSAAFAHNVSGVVSTYAATGQSTYTVPAGVTKIRVEAWGAAGADSNGTGPYVGQPGGAGGGALAILTVTPGQVLHVSVGAKAGGGAGGTGSNATNNRGGAASDVRSGSCAASLSCALTDRVVVAGGGGGPGAYAPGSGMIVACGGAGGSTGNGSGVAGCDERVQYPHVHGGGGGATSSAAGGAGYGATGGASYGAAGTLGFGGNGGGGGTGSSSPGGGGGDGYYGGGGGGGGNIYGGAGGGGGSSYVTASALSTQFLGAASTRGNGSVTISHAARNLILTAPSGDLASGSTRVLTARLTDSGGTVVSSAPDGIAVVTFTKTSGTGTVTGLGTATAVAGVATLTVTGGDVGSVLITATALGLTSTELSVPVVGNPQTITFAQPTSPAVYGSTFTIAPTASSGLAVSVAASGGCTLSGATVIMTSGTTSCVLTATRAASGNYAAATSVVRTVAAAKSTQATVTLAGTSSGTYGTNYTFTASGGSGTGDFSFSTAGGACVVDSSTDTTASIRITSITGSCIVSAMRAGDSDYSAGSGARSIALVARNLSVDAIMSMKVYGYGDPVSMYDGAILSGFAPDESEQTSLITGQASCTRTAGEDVGNYTITCAPGTLALANHTFSTGSTASFLITKASLTITASTLSKVYGAGVPTVTAYYTGLLEGDSLTTPPTCTTTATASSPTGTYSTSCSDAADPNYSIYYAPGALIVTTASLVITASTGSAVYGAAAPTITASYSGFVNGDTSGSLTTLPTCVSNTTTLTPVGSYASSCSGAVSTDYTISYAPGAVTVTTAPLLISASNGSNVYGSAAPTITPTYIGFRNGDDSTDLTSLPVCVSNTAPTTPVGYYAATSTCDSAVGSNYVIHYVKGNVQVSPRVLMVTASDGTSVYGSAAPNITPLYTGFVNGEDADDLSTEAVCESNTTPTTPVGLYDSSCSSATDPNYAIFYWVGEVSITRASLVVTASNGTSLFGAAAPGISPIYSGFVNGEDENDLTVEASCLPNTDADTPVGTYASTSTCANASGPNYSVSYVPGTVTITRAPLLITASDGTNVYGSAAPTITPGYTGFVNGDDANDLTAQPSCVPNTDAATPVGDYDSSCSGATSPNYSISYAVGTVTVARAPLVVTASDGTSIYGSAAATITPGYSGFVNGEDEGDLTDPAECVSNTTPASPVATYASSCSGASDPNYAISYVDGVVTITPADLVITASDGTNVYGSAAPAITPGYTGFVNSEGATDLTVEPTCAPNTVPSTPVGVYSATSTCAGASDPNYTISYVAGTVTVTLAPLVITASDGTSVYGAVPPTITPSYSGWLNGDTELSLTTQAECESNTTTTTGAGSYDSSCADATSANYEISYLTGTTTITPAPLKVTASSGSSSYGDAPPTITPSYRGFVNGDTGESLDTKPTCTSGTDASSHAKEYPGSASCAGAADRDYTISYVSGDVSIGTTPLTLTVADVDWVVGEPEPEFTLDAEGFVNGDTVAELTGDLIFTTDADFTGDVGSYSVDASGLTSTDYLIDWQPGTLTVLEAPVDEPDGGSGGAPDGGSDGGSDGSDAPATFPWWVVLVGGIVLLGGFGALIFGVRRRG